MAPNNTSRHIIPFAHKNAPPPFAMMLLTLRTKLWMDLTKFWLFF